MKHKGITIKDVAAKVGVSPSTVSYALSGKRSISRELRSKIEAAVAELGYSANALARRLRTGRSHTLGMLYPWSPTTSQILAMELLAAAAEAAQQADYTMAIYTQPLKPRKIIELLENQILDGVLLASIQPQDKRVEALRKTNFPFVLIGRTANPEALSYVDFDYERGCFEGIEHLARLGHRHIGAIAPAHESRELTYVSFMDRGFTKARADLEISLYQGIGGNVELAYASTLRLLEEHPKITGLFATHSRDYVGIMRALHHRRLEVPRDLSVVAIATAQNAEITIPKLTTIDLPLKAMGQTGAKMLMDRLESKEHIVQQKLLYAGLIGGDTTRFLS